MTNEKFCQGCSQHDDCREVYRQLGRIKGSSVTLKVIIAFLLPIMVFIGTLALFINISPKITDTRMIQTVISFLLALTATFIYLLAVKVINRVFTKQG